MMNYSLTLDSGEKEGECFLRRALGPETLPLDHSQRLRLLASGPQRNTHLFSQALPSGRDVKEALRNLWRLAKIFETCL